MNIKLVDNQPNRMVMSLTESVTLTGSPIYFLFNFVDEVTNDNVLFTAPDISSSTTIYNEFTINLTGSSFTDLTAGTISLQPEGKWKYSAYEMLSQTNLDISGTTGTILEVGYITVEVDSGSTVGVPKTYYSGSPTTWSFYDPNA